VCVCVCVCMCVYVCLCVSVSEMQAIRQLTKPICALISSHPPMLYVLVQSSPTCHDRDGGLYFGI
jgi:ABC-type proline/glycine betaine transport system permease subunit